MAILCFLLLGERLGKLEVISVFSALFGVILLFQPSLIFPSLKDENQIEDEIKKESSARFYFGMMLSFTGALANSGVYVICRKIGKDIHISV